MFTVRNYHLEDLHKVGSCVWILFLSSKFTNYR